MKTSTVLPASLRVPETEQRCQATLTVGLQLGLLLRQEAQALAPLGKEAHSLWAGLWRPACGGFGGCLVRAGPGGGRQGQQTLL